MGERWAGLPAHCCCCFKVPRLMRRTVEVLARSNIPHLLKCRHALCPPLLGLDKAAGLLVDLGTVLKHTRKLPHILVLVPPHRQLADGDGAIQEGEALTKAAANQAKRLGLLNEEAGDEVVVEAELAL